jgi:hypothetical protein
VSTPTIIETDRSFIIIDHDAHKGSTEYVRGVCTRGVSDEALRKACGKTEETISGLPRVSRFPITAGAGVLERIEAFQVAAYTGD